MGERNSIPGSDLENLKKNLDMGDVPSEAVLAGAGGETTVDTGGSGVATPRAEDRVSIGPYVLMRKLGEGGMGQVWLAEQTAPVKRRVALKLIKGGLYDGAVIQRFESERQSLAVMNHPAIAKVFDAGTTKDGQPYFAMEYVEGPSITRYCDSKRLTIRERLNLFIKVCEGVQHAHQKAIIHRDLKPSNVLVVEVDGKPFPRIIDFGVAKAISSQPSADHTMFTRVGALVGTPGFMSPEQADPGVQDVDTRTDVYSLGMILYVLLAGTLPFNPEEWKKKPFDEVLRQLREEDPPSPSTKLGEEKETATAAAKTRGTEPNHLARLLQGDLDCIALKAIEKDRTRRYGTPSDLAADLQRYLENRPVIARPPSAGYRLRKYVRRHLVGVGVVTGLVLLLAGFAAVQAVQLRRITRERDRASRVTDFMKSMFKVSDPSEARGNSITAREVLDKASKDIDAGLTKDPEQQAQLMDVMGNVYESLGLHAQAETLLARAVKIRRDVLGLKSRDTLASMDSLGWVLFGEGRYADAEQLERETLDVNRRAFGSEDVSTLTSMSTLAITLGREGNYAEAEKLQREVLDLERRKRGAEDHKTLAAMNNLSGTLMYEGHYAEAEKVQREMLEIQRRVFGLESPNTLTIMSNLGTTLGIEGQYEEAEKLVREALETQRRIFGPEHPVTLVMISQLSSTLAEEGRYAEAEKLFRETLDIRHRILGPEHPDTLWTMGQLGRCLIQEGRYAEAERLLGETLDLDRRVLGLQSPETLSSMNNLARALLRQGDYAEAEKLVRDALETGRGVLGPNHPETASSTYILACIAARRGHQDEALSLLREAVDHGLLSADDLGIEKEPDLKSLRGNPRFVALVAYAKEHATAAQKPN